MAFGPQPFQAKVSLHHGGACNFWDNWFRCIILYVHWLNHSAMVRIWLFIRTRLAKCPCTQLRFYKFFGPGGLRAPCLLACAMRSLVIVITIVQSLLSLFFSLRLLLLTHFGKSPVCENLFPPIFWHN